MGSSIPTGQLSNRSLHTRFRERSVWVLRCGRSTRTFKLGSKPDSAEQIKDLLRWNAVVDVSEIYALFRSNVFGCKENNDACYYDAQEEFYMANAVSAYRTFSIEENCLRSRRTLIYSKNKFRC